MYSSDSLEQLFAFSRCLVHRERGQTVYMKRSRRDRGLHISFTIFLAIFTPSLWNKLGLYGHWSERQCASLLWYMVLNSFGVVTVSQFVLSDWQKWQTKNTCSHFYLRKVLRFCYFWPFFIFKIVKVASGQWRFHREALSKQQQQQRYCFLFPLKFFSVFFLNTCMHNSLFCN